MRQTPLSGEELTNWLAQAYSDQSGDHDENVVCVYTLDIYTTTRSKIAENLILTQD